MNRASHETKITYHMEYPEGTLDHASLSRSGRLQHWHRQDSRKAGRYNESLGLGKLEYRDNLADCKCRWYKPGQGRLRIGVRRCLEVMQRYPL